MIACFFGNTLVFTPIGYIKIEELIENDKIYSWDINSKLIESKVIKIYKKQVNGYYILKCLDELIFVTAEHPFYVKDKGWVTVKNLNVGDLLVGNRGLIAIDSIIYKDETASVYNITIEEPNTYLITTLKILVHNK